MPYALAVSNGTVALSLALEALGIGEGDEVIVPDMTFAASINSIIHVGRLCENHRSTIVPTMVFENLGFQRLIQFNENACENKVRKRYAELIVKGSKMESKWEA